MQKLLINVLENQIQLSGIIPRMLGIFNMFKSK